MNLPIEHLDEPNTTAQMDRRAFLQGAAGLTTLLCSNVLLGEESVPPLLAQEWAKQGAEALQAGKKDQALRCYYEAYKLQRKNVDYMLQVGDLLHFFNEYTKALTFFDAIISQDAHHLIAKRKRIDCLCALNFYKDALPEIEALEPHFPEDALLKYKKGLCCHISGSYDLALEAYASAETKELPDAYQIELHCNRGYIYEAQQNIPLAAKEFSIVLQSEFKPMFKKEIIEVAWDVTTTTDYEAEALHLVKLACEPQVATDASEPLFLHSSFDHYEMCTLAVAYQNTQQFELARAYMIRAMELAEQEDSVVAAKYHLLFKKYIVPRKPIKEEREFFKKEAAIYI